MAGKRPFIVLALGISMAACGGVEGPTWHGDVRPIVEARCASCHTSGGVGPFDLGGYAQVVEAAPVVADAVEDRRMPPWGAVAGHRAYRGDPSLTDAQIGALLDWVDAGMPEGDPDAPGQPLPRTSAELPDPSYTLALPEPYTPTSEEPDDYRCFLVDWPGEELEYVTAFEVYPGNRSVVHHVAAFLIRPDTLLGPSVFEQFAAFDAAVEGPGYRCFGGPSGEEDIQIPVQQIAQWVPGNGAVVFPEGTGIPVPPGSQVVLQVHYNTPAWDGEPDRTELVVATQPTADRVAAFAPYLDPAWPLGGMNIPSGQMVTHAAEGSPYGFFGLLLSGIDLSEGFQIHGVMMHMHRLGRNGSVHVLPAGGDEEVLVEVDPWDFDWQLTYTFDEAVSFGPDDRMRVSCTFDNRGGDTDVAWGEGSDDEMCVGNLFISEP